MKYPDDDQVMKYDYLSHRYVLTANGVYTQLGINLNTTLNTAGDANPSTLADRILRRVSQTVYAYLYRDSMNSDWLEYILATYAPLRGWVQEMLLAQLLYVLTNGFVSDYAGINIAKGHSMDIEQLRGRARIAPEVEDVALRTIPGLGYCLKYIGSLPGVPCELYHKEY